MNASRLPISNQSERTDDELMMLARSGTRSAFDELVRRHQLSSLKLASRYLNDTSAARDACQAAFLELYRGLPRYQPRGVFVHFLRQVVLNQCRMHRRKTRGTERALTLGLHLTVVALPCPHEDLLASERRREVDRAVSLLSDKLKEVVVLRYTCDHSLEEVASILEVPLGTVKSRLFAAMDKLKHHLNTAGGRS